MDSTTAQNAESVTAEPKDFSEYLSLKNSATSAPGVPPTDEKAAPASEPETEVSQETEEQAKDEAKGKELTDEEKSDRKRRNDERRERRWYEERGEYKARMRQLEEELERVKASQSKPEPAPKLEVKGKPTLQGFLDSGQFKTYEEAQEAYIEARIEFERKQESLAREAETAKKTFEQVKTAYRSDVKEFAKAHEDFADVQAEVAERLDSGDSGNELTAAILKSKNPASLIYHLGSNPELLDELGELVSDGDFPSALIRLGEIKASMSKAKPSVAPAKTEKTEVPRTPKHVAGSGQAAITREDRLKAAADANDFTAFRQASRS